MKVTPENINEYHSNPTLRHYYYKESVERYTDLKKHYVNKVDMAVITERRPNEDPKVQEYREKIIVAVTKRLLTKIINFLSGMRKAKDWSIMYKVDVKLPSSVVETESLKAYTEVKLPIYGSISNWMFSQLVTQYVLDSGAVVLTMPDISYAPEKNEYPRPVPVIYNADQVIDYRVGEYYILKSKETIFYQEGETSTPGVAYYVVTKETIERFDQTSASGDFKVKYAIENKTGRLPIQHTYGVVTDDNGFNVLSESRFAPMVPYLIEAIRYYNDFQIDMVLNVFMQYWRVATQDCPACKSGKVAVASTSKTANAAPIWKTCGLCGGSGKKRPGQFDHISVATDKLSSDQVHLPPAGYIQKNTEIPKQLYEAFKESCFNALSSVNCQNIDSIPISNVSAEYEVEQKEQQGILMHSVAEDIVRIGEGVLKDICDWRYSYVVPDKETRYQMLPTFVVPDRFDQSSTTQQMSDMKQLSESGVDPLVINAVQMDFTDKLFSSDKAVSERLRSILELDPFPGKPSEEIGMLKGFGLINEVDAKVKTYLSLLFDTASADKDFSKLSKPDKLEKLRELAKEMIAKEAGITEPDPNANADDPANQGGGIND